VSDSITLLPTEIEALTGYRNATKQLNVLHDRGFLRAFINRSGEVVLERAHYEAVSRGELHQPDQLSGGGKVANLDFLRKRA
jgi:hypothetical protein